MADAKLSPGSLVAGEAYFITNGEPVGFFEFVELLNAKLAYPKILFAVPYALAYCVASVAERLDTLRGGTLNREDGFSRFSVRYMCTHHYFDIGKARRDLGYAPKVSIREGIERTAVWVRESGLG